MTGLGAPEAPWGTPVGLLGGVGAKVLVPLAMGPVVVRGIL